MADDLRNDDPTWRAHIGRMAERVIAIYGAAVFVALWAGFAVALASGGAPLDDAWARLTSLEPVATVTAWILVLPIAIGLWAWVSELGAWATALVVVGLVAWTAVAANGLVRTFGRRT